MVFEQWIYSKTEYRFAQVSAILWETDGLYSKL